jgi:hypothetical protein
VLIWTVSLCEFLFGCNGDGDGVGLADSVLVFVCSKNGEPHYVNFGLGVMGMGWDELIRFWSLCAGGAAHERLYGKNGEPILLFFACRLFIFIC